MPGIITCMTACTIYPAFSSVIGVFNNTSDFSELGKISDYKFISNKSYDNHYITENNLILDDFPDIAVYLKDLFNTFKNQVLKYANTEFTITTSWGTLTKPGARSYTHCHKNSFYSGVVYWDDHPGANIDFERFDHSQWLIVPDEYNIYNAESLELEHKQNTVIFFPSYLPHKISTNTADKNRYSLAFNIIPVGLYGKNDSKLRVEYFKD